MAKSNSVISYGEDGDVLVFTVLGAGEVRLDMSKVHPDIVTEAAFYGMKQRIADAAAIPFAKNGRYATAEEKHAAMSRLAAYYESGASEWRRVSEAGEAKPKGGLLARALMELYPDKTREEVNAFLAGLKPAERGALKAKPSVKAIIDRMEAEKASEVDTDELLAGL